MNLEIIIIFRNLSDCIHDEYIAEDPMTRRMLQPTERKQDVNLRRDM